MRLGQKILLAIGLAWVAGGVSAAPELGFEYQKMSRPQATENAKKVEVIEFFAYYCPHCNALEPLLEDWLKKQGDNVVFKRVHGGGGDGEIQYMQKLYFTLEAMGKVDAYHRKVFQAYHIDRNHLMNMNDIISFVDKSGLDKQKFFDVYNSFSVQSKAQRAAQMMTTYGIESYPTFAVDGRFLTSPAMSVSRLDHRATEQEQNIVGIQTLDWLVQKLLKEKNGGDAVKATTKK